MGSDVYRSESTTSAKHSVVKKNFKRAVIPKVLPPDTVRSWEENRDSECEGKMSAGLPSLSPPCPSLT